MNSEEIALELTKMAFAHTAGDQWVGENPVVFAARAFEAYQEIEKHVAGIQRQQKNESAKRNIEAINNMRLP